MKTVLPPLAFAACGLLSLISTLPQSGVTETPPIAWRLTGRSLAGTVLAAPYQVLLLPVGGRVVRVYASEGQAVKSGEVLLKLTSGSGGPRRPFFIVAPAAGDVANFHARAGQYVAAGAVYARLTPRRPVQVRVAAADAARLCPGDSLRVVAGPVGLVGICTPVTAVMPDSSSATAVLVLGRQGWPPGTSVAVTLALALPRPAGRLPAN